MLVFMTMTKKVEGSQHVFKLLVYLKHFRHHDVFAASLCLVVFQRITHSAS